MSDESGLLTCGHKMNMRVGIAHLGATGAKICAPCNDRRKRALYQPEVIRRERRPLKAGSSTLVGFISMAEPTGPCHKCGHDHLKDPEWRGTARRGVTCMKDGCGGEIPIKDVFPLRGGNCCGVLNMNTENVEEALVRWPDLAKDCEVEIVNLDGRERVRVVDKRLSDDWKQHQCSGCGIYEGKGEPMPYPDPNDKPPESGFFTAPYIPLYKEPEVGDFSNMNIETIEFGGPAKEMTSTWSLDDDSLKDLDPDPE